MAFGKEILQGLEEFHNTLASGEQVSKKLTCRTVKLNLKPKAYDPETVKMTRLTLNVSQAVFAEFLGVSLKCVQAWEQGSNSVSGAAARMMDEIRRNPEYFRGRILEAVEVVRR